MHGFSRCGAARSGFSTHYLRAVFPRRLRSHMLLQFVAPHAVRCRDMHVPAGLPPLPVACSSPCKPLPRPNLRLRRWLPHCLRTRAIVIGSSRRGDPQHQRRGGRVRRVLSCRLSSAAILQLHGASEVPVPHLPCDQRLTPVVRDCMRLVSEDEVVSSAIRNASLWNFGSKNAESAFKNTALCGTRLHFWKK